MCVYRDQGDEDDYYDDRAPQTVNTLGEHWNILGLLVVNYRYLYYWYLNNMVVECRSYRNQFTFDTRSIGDVYIYNIR